MTATRPQMARPRTLVVLGLAAAVTLAVVVAVLVVIKPGELVLIVDPGEIVRTGYTLSKTASNLAAAVTIGAAFLVATALTAHKAARRSMFRLIRTAALARAGAGIVASVFTFANISGVPIGNASRSDFWSQASYYATGIELGQGWTATIVVALVIAVWASVAVPSAGHAAALALVGIGGLVPLAEQGHAASSASHNLAVVSILMHVSFASLWLGGLVGIVWLRRTLPARLLPSVMWRYSAAALVCFFAVALSGLVSATVRITDLTTLTSTSYGLILLGKIAVLLILGSLGASFRTRLLPLLESGRSRMFWVLVAVEVVFMGVASGLAAVLARTAPPGAEQEIYDTGPVTAAESLTGAAFPAAPTWSTVFSGQPDPVWLFAVATAGILYLGALRILARRRVSWRLSRTVVFLAGLFLALWVTCGPLSIYSTYRVSAYTLSVVLLLGAGMLLAAGRPGSLAALTLPTRADNSRGSREWARTLWTSQVAQVLLTGAGAGVTAGAVVVLAVLPWGMRWAVTDPVGRMVVFALVLVAGAGFSFARRRAQAAGAWTGSLRLGTVVVGALTLAGVTLLGPQRLADWFAVMNPDGLGAAATDQQAASLVLFATAALGVCVAAGLNLLTVYKVRK